MSDYVRRSAAEWAKVWEQASAASAASKALAAEATDDAGPTEADLRGEVDHDC